MRIDAPKVEVKEQETVKYATSTNNTKASNALQEEFKKFGCNNEQGCSKSKEVQAYELDFSNFKKSDKDHAFQVANTALSSMKNLVNNHNNNYPAKAYVIDYATFPNPANFNPKNFGGKEEAFTSWQTAVSSWVKTVENKIKNLETTGMQELVCGLQKQIFDGFVTIYTQQGLTLAEIKAVCEELHGDAKAIKQRLDRAVYELKNHAQNVGRGVANAVREEGALTRLQEALNTQATNEHIAAQHNATREEIEKEAAQIKEEIQTHVKEIINNAGENKDEIKKILNNILTELDKKPNKLNILKVLRDILTKGLIGISVEELQKVLNIVRGE